MNFKHYLMASAILSAATLAGGSANAVPCPPINGVTTCNVIITAGPGGSFVTTLPNPTRAVPTMAREAGSGTEGVDATRLRSTFSSKEK